MDVNVGAEYKRTLSYKNIIGRLMWNITSCLLFRPFGTRIFNCWRINLLRLFGAKIGGGCTIFSNVTIWAPWNLKMGNNSCLGPKVNCYNTGLVTIGDRVVISHGAYLCPGTHDFNNKDFPMTPYTITINNLAWIATEAFVGPKVTIGEGAVVGARACVFKDVEPWSVVGGNPAKFIKKRVIKEQC